MKHFLCKKERKVDIIFCRKKLEGKTKKMGGETKHKIGARVYVVWRDTKGFVPKNKTRELLPKRKKEIL